jgi:hypothetical protein
MKKELKHTPAPWRVNDQTASGWMNNSIYICTPKGNEVRLYNDFGNAEANAKLIAAAPDLLAVLMELEESSDYWGEYDVPLGIVERIKSAIAKATA